MKILSEKKQGLVAIIPIVSFVAILLGTGIVCSFLKMDQPFYQINAAVAGFFAVMISFIVIRDSSQHICDSLVRGMTDDNNTYIYITLILAGAFASVAKQSGGVDAIVNLGLSVFHPSLLACAFFMISAVLGIATGSCGGTVTTVGPIAVTMCEAMGANIPMILACVMMGGSLGDNLSVISDTTIVATRSQHCEMRDKFKMNGLIVLPAAIIMIMLLLAFGRTTSDMSFEIGEYSLLGVVPYIFVIVSSVIGINIFVCLGGGTFIAGVIGIFSGKLTFLGFSSAILDGFCGIADVIFMVMMVTGLFNVALEYGGLDAIFGKIRGIIRGEKSAEFAIILIVSLGTISTGMNTTSLIATGNLVREISVENKIDPRRTASIMDISSCVWHILIPYGVINLIACSISGGVVNAFEMLPYTWYNMLLGVFLLISIFVPYDRCIIKNDPWDWEHDCASSRLKDAGKK